MKLKPEHRKGLKKQDRSFTGQITWKGRKEGSVIMFGDIRGYDKKGVLQYSFHGIITERRIPKTHSVEIDVEINWNKYGKI